MKYFLWILGFIVGFILPPVAGFAAALHVPLPPGPLPINLWAGFYVCLGVALLLTVLGGILWRRSAFARGLGVASGIWLLLLPALFGNCAK